MSEWKQVRLGDYAETFAGGTPDRSNAAFFGGEIPWVKSTEVNLGRIKQTEEFLTEDGLYFSAAKWIPARTVLIALYGATAAQIAYLEIAATANQAVLAVIPNEHIDSVFLFYALTAIKEQILFKAQGSGQPNLNKQIIDQVVVDLPPLFEQHRIAEILSVLDQTIEKTEALIEKYQHIKAGLMHDLLTRGIGTDGKLRPPREQAPELYQQTPIGWIPKDWKPLKLKDILKNSGGYLQTGPFGSQLHSHEYTHEGIPVVMPQDINNGIMDEIQIARIPERRAQSLLKHRLKIGDIIIARRGELSRAAAIANIEQGWVCGTGCFLLRLGGSNLDARFFSLIYRHPMVQRQVEGLAVGSTMPSLNNEIMGKLLFPDMSKAEQTSIADKVQLAEVRITTLNSELVKLQKQKSGLMHDLLTGKVQVNIEVTHASTP
jgi:type I restriction enzyme S subunit